MIIGTRTGVTTTATAVSLPTAFFTSAASYKCTAQNVTDANARVLLAQVDGDTFNLTSQTGTISVNWICVGN